jgi:hypothetical protein
MAVAGPPEASTKLELGAGGAGASATGLEVIPGWPEARLFLGLGGLWAAPKPDGSTGGFMPSGDDGPLRERTSTRLKMATEAGVCALRKVTFCESPRCTRVSEPLGSETMGTSSTGNKSTLRVQELKRVSRHASGWDYGCQDLRGGAFHG